MQSPAFEQTDYRARNDDGSESGATWQASTNTGWAQFIGDPFRVRIAVTEVNGVKENNVGFQLQYSHNGGAWTNVTGSSSVVQATASSHVSDGTATTQQITTNTFVSGYLDAQDGAVAQNIDFANGGETTEVEFNLSIVEADVTDGDTIDFRVIRADGTVLSAYTNVATTTVDADFTATAQPAATSSGALSASATITRTIGGTVTVGGTAQPNATVYITAVDESGPSATLLEQVTTDSNGEWTATVSANTHVHVSAKYDDGALHSGLSKPYI